MSVRARRESAVGRPSTGVAIIHDMGELTCSFACPVTGGTPPQLLRLCIADFGLRVESSLDQLRVWFENEPFLCFQRRAVGCVCETASRFAATWHSALERPAYAKFLLGDNVEHIDAL